MHTGIIIYQSKYGATEKYAKWLAKATGYEYIETPKASISEIVKYEEIILCGGIYASGIAGLGFLKKNYSRLSNKRTAVFCVGASPFDQKAFEELRAFNLKGELKNIPLFYGRGAWNEEKMSFKDRTLCRLLQKAVAKKAPNELEPWMKALMCAAGQKCDWTDKAYLTPLIEYIYAKN